MPATLATNPWPTWQTALDKFAAASTLLVSAWDADGARRLGPCGGTRLTGALVASDGWRPGGAAEAFERALAEASIGADAEQEALFAGQLRVHAVPMRRFGEPYGAVICGWVLADFATSLGAERLSQLLALPSRRIWSLARLETPVSAARMAHHVALLGTLVDSITSSLENITRLEEQREMRALFLSHATHELRTPLNAIGMRVELLLQSPLDRPQVVRDALEKVRHNVRNESRLIHDLLEAAVTNTGRFPLHRAPTDLRAVARAAHDVVAPTAEARGVRLSLEEPAGEAALPILADADRLQQSIWNILSNAVKFTPAHAAVHMRIGVTDDGFEVEVRDEGPGIEPDLLPHLFDPFTRRKERNSSGLGLGLSIARPIVAQHGGTITVVTRPTIAGTSFRIWLPAAGA